MKKYSEDRLIEISQERKREYAGRLAARAKDYGICLFACCNDYLLSNTVQKSSCIDAHYLSQLYQSQFDTRLALSREECACTKSVDIGAYDTCAHGCLYCYANSDQTRAQAALIRHEPTWNALGEQVSEVHCGHEKTEQSLLL